MPAVECLTCGAEVPAESRFCSECGAPNPVADGVETRLRKYWSAPDLGLIAGLALAAVGIVLLGAQLWLWALLALVLAAAVFLFRWEAGRRRTRAALARLSVHRRVVGARSRGQLELFRLRRELAELQTERNQAYQELGRATYAGDAHAARAAAAHVGDVGARILAREAEIGTLLEEMEERVRQAQAEVTPTRSLEAPPEPAQVPEPLPEPVSEPRPDDPARRPEPSSTPETKRRRASRASNP
jgi:zinc-ribbon domain